MRYISAIFGQRKEGLYISKVGGRNKEELIDPKGQRFPQEFYERKGEKEI